MTVKVWDAVTGACISTLEGHSGFSDFVVGVVCVKRIEARDMPNVELVTSLGLADNNDPYAVLSFGGRKEWSPRTSTQWEGGGTVSWDVDDSEAGWRLRVTRDELVCDQGKLRVVLMDANRVFSDTLIGQAEVSLKGLAEGGVGGPVQTLSATLTHPERGGEYRGTVLLSVCLAALSAEEQQA